MKWCFFAHFSKEKWIKTATLSMTLYDNISMRSVATYLEHVMVRSASTKGTFESAYKAFAGIEDMIDSHPKDEQVYDYLQARINALQARKMSPITIDTYFSHIKQYLHYRGIRLHQTDIRQCLNFPKKQVEEMRPLELDTFQKILKTCSAKREMLYLAQSSSGMRIGEMVQLRKKDIHTNMARLAVKIPAAFTKTRVARTTFFSSEAAQLVAPRLKKIGDSDLVFGTSNNVIGNTGREARYISELQKKMGISDKYETNGRNVITTHSFRAFFITKVSRKDPNLAKYFAGQKGYLLQYDRQTDAEKLAIYMEFESLLLVSDKARDQEKIRKLEQENARMREFENKNKDLKREIKDLKRGNKDLKKENKDLKRGNKNLAKKVHELEGTTHVATMEQRPDPQSKTEPFSFDPYSSVLHNSPCSLRTCTGLAYFGLHRSCPHVYQPVVRGYLDPDFLHHVLPL